MEKLPKIDEFNTPEGYFEQLPDQILDSLQSNRDFGWMKYAAAILVFLAAGIWALAPFEQENIQLTFDQEVNLYIDSQYWTAEDVLSMADNPNEILEQIIEEEFPESELLWEEDQNWF